MRIGILTYHKSYNYGALLQAMALRNVLSDMGHDAFFVDYWPEYHRKMYALFDKEAIKWKSPIQTIMYLIKFLGFLPYSFSKKKKFNKFIEAFISPYCKDTSYEFDLIVCGSDQIWRKQPRLNDNFNPVYFSVNNINARNYISYAASMGSIDLTESDKINLKRWLNGFFEISVREESLENELFKLGFCNIKVVADPTLLILKKQWLRKINNRNNKIKGKYLLYYTLQKDSFDILAIEKYARDHKLKVVELRAFAGLGSYKASSITSADPYDMLRLIANAEIVFTSSFHGLVFSILFERQFVTSFSTNGDRAKSLLKLLNLEDRMIPVKSQNFSISEIDFFKVNAILDNFRNDSLKWLQDVIRKVDEKKE